MSFTGLNQSINNFTKSTAKLSDGEYIGIEGFTAFAEISSSMQFTAQVPELTLEDGSTISDHIIIKQPSITINGIVSDKYIRRNPLVKATIETAKNVGLITSYLPKYTDSQRQAIQALGTDIFDKAAEFDKILQDGQSLYSYYVNSGESITKSFFNFIADCFAKKQTIRIETGTILYDKCAITLFERSAEEGETDSFSFTLSFTPIITVKLNAEKSLNPSAALLGMVDDKKSSLTANTVKYTGVF